MAWLQRKRPDSAAFVQFLENFQFHKHLSGSDPQVQSLGNLMCPGVAVGRTARGVHAALTETDGISCSPQEGELRTLTQAF